MNEQMRTKADVLVIGGSCSGLIAAIRIKETNKELDVAVVDKGYIGKVGSAQYSGGDFLLFLPGVHDRDAWMRQFIEAGGYLADQEWVKLHLQESYPIFCDLLAWGVPAKGQEYDYCLQEEGFLFRNIEGQDILCRSGVKMGNAAKLVTRKFLPALRKKARESGVRLFSHMMVTDLLQEGERICGAVGFERRTGEFHLFEAKATIIATGSMGFKGGGCGIGFITGDGMAMSYRCGAEIVHAEFLVGCHRTGLKSLDTAYAHVFGGNYLNRLGYPIEDSLVTKAHHTGELNKCLEMAKQHHAGLGPFYIDLSLEDAKARIDRVREQLQRPEDVGMPVLLTLERAGIDVRTSMGKVEITLFHQGAMGHGGIRVDKNCRSQLEALYVSGDSAGVLLSSSHWGSGLASAAVTGNIAGKNAAKYAETINHISLNPSNIQRLKERTFEALHRNKGFSPDEATLMVQKAILPYDVQIVRHGKRLQTALKEIERLRDDVLPNLKATDPHDLVKVHEVRNMALCAEITLRTSLFRKESRIPTFYREDYPERDDENWLKWTVTKEKHGRMEISGESVPFSQYEFKPWQKEC